MTISATGDSLYIILGIEKTSTPEEIKRTYRKVSILSNKIIDFTTFDHKYSWH